MRIKAGDGLRRHGQRQLTACNPYLPLRLLVAVVGIGRMVRPSGQSFINRGQSLTVAASGIRPQSSKPVTFNFDKPSGVLVKSLTYPGGNGNCVMNQQLVYIDPALFTTPGLYKVYATYFDGNSNAQIVKDWIGTLGQQIHLDVR